MTQDNLIRIELIKFGSDANGREIIEQRIHALADASMRWFSPDDLNYVNRSIEHYRHLTGMESSDDSHGVAWKTRGNGDPMPFEASWFSDEPVSLEQLRRVAEMAVDRGWKTK